MFLHPWLFVFSVVLIWVFLTTFKFFLVVFVRAASFIGTAYKLLNKIKI